MALVPARCFSAYISAAVVSTGRIDRTILGPHHEVVDDVATYLPCLQAI